MFKRLITILLAAVGISLAAADKLAIAEPVGKGGINPEQIEAFWGILEANVGGDFEIVSRAALKQLITEAGLTNSSDLVNPNSLQKARIGELKGVKYILASEINRIGTRFNVNLMTIESSTGTIDPKKRGSIIVNNFDELSDRVGDMLREFGLGRPIVMSGRAALLLPIVKQATPPAYLTDEMTSKLQEILLENNIKLFQLQSINKILRDNKIGNLEEAEPAMYVRVGELLRADYLIQPVITRFSTRIDQKYIAASKRTVVKCIGDMNGNVRIINAKTGDLISSINFRERIDFSDISSEVDTSEWTPEDYGNYLIDATLKPVGKKILEKLKTEE